MQTTVQLSFCLLLLGGCCAQSAIDEHSLDQCSAVGCSGYQCFESTAKCGQQGYLLAYGDKYCHRFHEAEIFHNFDKAGQQFIHCTGQCLLDDMQDYFKIQNQSNQSTSKIDCEHLQETAFDSHVNCYLKCNFCHICKTNKMALWKTYDIRDFLNLLAIKKVFTTIFKCGIFQCF